MAVGFYVTSIDGTKVALMRGPFATEPVAEAMVEPTFNAVDKIDPRAWFRSWGVTKIELPTLPLGNYDKYLAAKG